jgi:uncharacterized membrane-anchored protein YjiN (DUF445 family)
LRPSLLLMESRQRPPRRQRRLALGVLVGAAGLSVFAFPFRLTWWGGWILAIAEAGVVGGLADWFAVTAIFRRPLGLPIPHTALIPRNWEQMAARVGTMVGDRVLTKDYVQREIAQIDVAELAARGAARLRRDDLRAVTRIMARWAAEEVSPTAAAEMLAGLRRLVAGQPIAPTLAALLDIARQHGWDESVVSSIARSVAQAVERPAVREALRQVVDDLIAQYRALLAPTSRMWLGLANFFGLVDHDRIVNALESGLRSLAEDPGHPLRARLSITLAALPARLRDDPKLAAQVESAKAELLATPAVARMLDEAAAALHAAFVRDVSSEGSELVRWVADRLERARQALIADAAFRAAVDRWIKARVMEFVERHHGRIAAFIENGVRALGPEGAVRLIEEHAGDDLQYIRVNGTVVGGLAGGAIYAVHLLLGLF